MNSSFLIVGNGPYANRGCEAIAKSSIPLIRSHFPDAKMVNGNPFGDYDQLDETEPDVVHETCQFFPAYMSRMWMTARIFEKTGIVLDLSTPSKLVRSHAPDCGCVLSMGGDLYGLSLGHETLMQYMLMGEAAIKAGKPFVIWGATIGRIDSKPRLAGRVFKHFRRCSLILVRDQDSFDYLKENGVDENVRLVADPAFLLQPSEPKEPLPNREPLAETIGFNLAAAYGRSANVGTFRDMIELGADCVQEISRTTGRAVLLVPHVVAYPSHACPDNDTIYLALVRERLAARGVQVDMLPSSLRSWEIKWVLGQLKAYVGSRFHSTVGSMGSGTPTLSISFSEKGPALSRFLLGHADFTIDCRQLTPGGLSERLQGLMDAEEDVRATLARRLPEVRELSRSAGEHLRSVLA